MKDGYTRSPQDCGKCRIEHNVSPFHYGPDPEANCGKCISDETIKVIHDRYTK